MNVHIGAIVGRYTWKGLLPTHVEVDGFIVRAKMQGQPMRLVTDARAFGESRVLAIFVPWVL